ncbi:hypothetical protein JMUB7504_27180 [Staphylococcus aureus]
MNKRKMDVANQSHSLGYTILPVKLDKEVLSTICVLTVEQ